MKEHVVGLLIIYGVITGILAIANFTAKDGPCHDPSNLEPLPNDSSMDRDFGVLMLFILAWPILLAGLIVIGIPMILADKFLCTPGFSCCGLSCAKYRQPRKPKPTAARSDEHNREAGLAPPLSSSGSVIAVPPPAYTVMELRPIPKPNTPSTPSAAPPSYIR